jgi:hypothetical protein
MDDTPVDANAGLGITLPRTARSQPGFGFRACLRTVV